MLFFGAGGCILLLCCCLGFLTRRTSQQVLGPTMSWREQITMSKFPSPTFNFVSQLNPRESGIPIQKRSTLQNLPNTIHKKRSPIESSFLQMVEGRHHHEDFTIVTPGPEQKRMPGMQQLSSFDPMNSHDISFRSNSSHDEDFYKSNTAGTISEFDGYEFGDLWNRTAEGSGPHTYGTRNLHHSTATEGESIERVV